jgi:hypothetical protein
MIIEFISGVGTGLGLGAFISVMVSKCHDCKEYSDYYGVASKHDVKFDMQPGSKIKVKGSVFMPESEYDIAREKLLERNRELGIDTKLEELQ